MNEVGRMLLALLTVLALIALLAGMRWVKSYRGLCERERGMCVIGRLPMTARAQVVMVAIHNKQIAIGIAGDSLTVLSVSQANSDMNAKAEIRDGSNNESLVFQERKGVA
ncbi:flagellar biosynthetic protein FliO [bacterium]|nr:flagellar biosynthetic protein FliO [candidate division CSSED10-310 bacterium]